MRMTERTCSCEKKRVVCFLFVVLISWSRSRLRRASRRTSSDGTQCHISQDADGPVREAVVASELLLGRRDDFGGVACEKLEFEVPLVAVADLLVPFDAAVRLGLAFERSALSVAGLDEDVAWEGWDRCRRARCDKDGELGQGGDLLELHGCGCGLFVWW